MAAPSQEFFKSAYAEDTILPWEITTAQPRLAQLFSEKPGLLHGTVLDMCSGVGRNSMLAAAQPGVVSVTGVEFNDLAVHRATSIAKESGVTNVTFYHVNVLEPVQQAGLLGHTFDCIVDSASYHCFSLEDRDKYVQFLESFAHSGSLLILLCFTPKTERLTPRKISLEEIYSVFSAARGWAVESLEETVYETNNVPDRFRSAWLAIIRRL